MQTDDGNITNYYNPVNCTEIFDENEDPQVPDYFYAQLNDMKCPQMNGNNIQLKSVHQHHGKLSGREFKFIIDICSNLQEHSGSTCIGDPEVEREAIKDIVLIGQ